jgi:hypothetical protein
MMTTATLKKKKKKKKKKAGLSSNVSQLQSCRPPEPQGPSATPKACLNPQSDPRSTQ